MWTLRSLLTAHLLLLALPHTSLAADRVQECIGEHVEAQLLRNQGRLVAAQARFMECSKPTCPALVRDECVTMRQEVESALPSVVLSALDESGRPTFEPMVSVDNLELVPLDGRSVTLDPGEHRLRFQHPDGATREVKLVLAEAEHDRSVVADFRLPLNRETTGGAENGASTVMLASGGAAALALGAFTYFALSGRALENELDRCKPNCTDRDDLDRMRSHYLVADVSLGIALVSVGVGAYAWAKQPSAASSSRAQNVNRLAVSVLPVLANGRVGLRAMGAF